jgi:hypothetical protein
LRSWDHREQELLGLVLTAELLHRAREMRELLALLAQELLAPEQQARWALLGLVLTVLRVRLALRAWLDQA